MGHSGTDKDYTGILEECLKEERLFEDKTFPAENRSLYFTGTKEAEFEDYEIVWRRPKEIVESPQFLVDGPSRFDVKQGYLGNCWFLAATAALATRPKLFHKVVPDDNSFEDGAYAGIFHFRFFEHGKWVEVVIDDRLPVNAESGKLMFANPKDPNKFWGPLIEKAYAKFHGSYEAIEGGLGEEAFDHLTGGFCDRHDLRDEVDTAQFTQIVQKALNSGSLIWTATGEDDTVREGLHGNHAYTVTGLYGDKVKVRNPWGSGEWSGDWSDQSKLWDTVDAEEKEACGFNARDDGEFFMSINDFLECFELLDICYFSPDALEKCGLDDSTDSHSCLWYTWSGNGQWEKGISDGGSNDYIWTFYKNPQYQLNLGHSDSSENASVLIALTQKTGERGRRFQNEDFISIGFTIYKMDKYEKGWIGPQFQDFFKKNEAVELGKEKVFEKVSKANSRLELEHGTYVIVPSSESPGQPGEFYLQIVADANLSVIFPKKCSKSA